MSTVYKSLDSLPSALRNSLLSRAQNKCELCANPNNLQVAELSEDKRADETNTVVVCDVCTSPSASRLRVFNESIWSEHQPVKVLSARLMISNGVDWRDIVHLGALDDEEMKLALDGITEEVSDSSAPTLDSNGTRLADGDSVTLIKDLDVKGGGFTAKRGTLVKNISLTSNPKHVEGKVNGIQIVLVAAYLKRA